VWWRGLPRQYGAEPRHLTIARCHRSLPRRHALRARTILPQIKPRINSQIVLIVEGKLQRILAHRLRRQSLHRRLEHRQSPRRQLRHFARLPSRLRPLIPAKCAGTSVPQIRKRIDRPVPILPLDLHPRPGSQMNHHRFGIVPDARRKIRQSHKIQYIEVSVARTCPERSRRVPRPRADSENDHVGRAAPGCPSRGQRGSRSAADSE
jgi:hypothetical protein